MVLMLSYTLSISRFTLSRRQSGPYGKTAGIGIVSRIVIEGRSAGCRWGRIKIVVEVNAIHLITVYDICDNAGNIIPYGRNTWVKNAQGALA